MLLMHVSMAFRFSTQVALSGKTATLWLKWVLPKVVALMPTFSCCLKDLPLSHLTLYSAKTDFLFDSYLATSERERAAIGPSKFTNEAVVDAKDLVVT